jgi:16S rRNA processing protein RimM
VNWDDMALVGRVARPHGIRGHVVVNPDTDFPQERFRPGAELFIRRPDGTIEALAVTSARFYRERPIIGLHGVDDMSAAERLAGAELRVPVERLARLPEGAFYHHDLVGCVVVTLTGTAVGTVKKVEGHVGASRLVVDTPGGDVLVPLAEAICRTIDPRGKRIVIDPPDGLLELNQ